ncbi:putative Thioredoxin-like superfamily [Arabidopsis thaliana]|uniref:Thioredoxin superfamily protein n=1 Tax=Arabidopsis thaliana TaxID=3702 RepID=A0A1P8BEG6_ARATH|nr:Thioredoxin superfamily protein [Arabidopsis thaliana]ANM69999.1 Thioredoxin superfamily protein [Arabidopsis thaliana]|eukprot:NP_001331642.1 Thioredoxin superfamily protein [Arabidopsis thaliana]
MKIYKPKKKAHHCRRSRDSNIPLQISESKSEEAANQLQMGDSTFLDRMLLQLRSTCKYYSGYPKDLGPSRVLHFTSEREFVQLLHQGYPVVVAFTIRSNYTQHLDRMLEEAAAEFYPNIKFMRVECPKYPGFCITRQKNEYPFIEIFHSPQHAGNEGKVQDPNITRYSVKVVPYNYDMSPYGFREFFKRQGVRTSDPK